MNNMYAVAMAAVTELVVTILALFYLGRLGDEKFGTKGLLMAVGAILGCIVGFIRLAARLKTDMDKPPEKPDVKPSVSPPPKSDD